MMQRIVVPSLGPLIAINPKKLREVLSSLSNKSTVQAYIPLQGSLEFQNQRLNDTMKSSKPKCNKS